MGRLILIALAALLIAPATASACAALPAGFSEKVGVTDDTRQGSSAQRRSMALKLCVAGRRLLLRRTLLVEPYGGAPRGTTVDGAAAAGRRVTWIETRFARGRRTVVVRTVRVGARGRVRPERRLVVHRDRELEQPYLDVVITARGELAWLKPWRGRGARVVYDPPRGAPRAVGTTDGHSLWVEDRMTLAWYGSSGYGFFDARDPSATGCPRRSRYSEVASSAAVVVTEGLYADGERQVLRACVRATGLDPVIGQADRGMGNGDWLSVPGLDGHWLVLVRSSFSRYDPCLGGDSLSTVDVRTGRTARHAGGPRCFNVPLMLPAPGAPLAVTERGVPAWIDSSGLGRDRLFTVAPDGRVVDVDVGDPGALIGLRADGTWLHWSNAGAPRSAEPA